MTSVFIDQALKTAQEDMETNRVAKLKDDKDTMIFFHFERLWTIFVRTTWFVEMWLSVKIQRMLIAR